MFSIIYSCSKVEETAITQTTNGKTTSNANARKGTETDSLEYYANLISPTRDIANFSKMTGVLPEKQALKYDATQQAAVGGGGNNGDCYNLPACNGITFPLQSGWSCTAIPGTDTFNNTINAYGQYGADPRQRYYVNYPPNKSASSPIVVLIHGGGWYTGPNPDNIQGWTRGFTTNKPDNLVKNLLDNGFVVVTLLYRLSRYGNEEPDFSTNPTKLSAQLDDIDAGILHVRTNFPSCLGINANSIQVLGESAGGHLALMWAYTKTTIPKIYIKSAIDMYAPTNMQQYGSYLQNIPINQMFVCDGQFKGFPWYLPILDLTNPFENYNTTIFDCKASGYANSRVIQSYKMIQSLVGLPISTPLTSTDLFNASPCNTLVSSRIIPTFVMHGKNDGVVPYSQSTNNMSVTLTNVGGLAFDYSSSSGVVPTTYFNIIAKHGIKQYDNANHSWLTNDNNSNTQAASQSALYTLIKSDVIKWLNGHK